jgi:hypothetical protein
MTTYVTETPAASSEVAVHHFEDMLAFETDCSDVHESLKGPSPDFVLVECVDRTLSRRATSKVRSTSRTAR